MKKKLVKGINLRQQTLGRKPQNQEGLKKQTYSPDNYRFPSEEMEKIEHNLLEKNVLAPKIIEENQDCIKSIRLKFESFSIACFPLSELTEQIFEKNSTMLPKADNIVLKNEDKDEAINQNCPKSNINENRNSMKLKNNPANVKENEVFREAEKTGFTKKDKEKTNEKLLNTKCVENPLKRKCPSNPSDGAISKENEILRPTPKKLIQKIDESLITSFQKNNELEKTNEDNELTSSKDLISNARKRENKKKIQKLEGIEQRNIKYQIETSSPNKKLNVLISGFVLEEKKIESLNSIGIEIFQDFQTEVDILVLRTFKRTAKLLCSINKGIPFIDSEWIEECLNKKKIINYSEYQFVDDFAENKYDFSLRESLKKAVEKYPKGIFSNYHFWISGNVETALSDLKIIISTGQGKIFMERPKENEGDAYEIVSIDKINEKIDCKCTLRQCSSEDIIVSSLRQSTEYIGRMLLKKNEK
jgi:hypothetical protein